MLNIVLFGPPGAGKGTQSEKLINKYQLVHLSTGDILRAERKAETELGKKADEFIKAGKLVPDEVVIGMIGAKLEENKGAKGFIFDGFPRTIAQAEALDVLLKEHNTQISCMLSLEVEDNELVTRLLERGKTSGRADDQDESIIRTRMETYKNETSPVKGYYAQQNKTSEINGIGAIEEIFDRLCTVINQYV